MRVLTRREELLIQAPAAHVDESGVRAAGSLHWLRAACISELTFYGVHSQRGSEAMDALKGS